jgi:hypothetical protein
MARKATAKAKTAARPRAVGADIAASPWNPVAAPLPLADIASSDGGGDLDSIPGSQDPALADDNPDSDGTEQAEADRNSKYSCFWVKADKDCEWVTKGEANIGDILCNPCLELYRKPRKYTIN